MTEKDEDLERSTRRLGDRFGAAKSSGDGSQHVVEGDEESDSDEPDSDESETDTDTDIETGSSSSPDQNSESESDDVPDSEDAPEWVPTTLYLPEETRRDLRRFLKRLTLDYPDIEDAQKRELHAALVQVAMNQSEAVADRTEQLSNADD